MVKIFSLSIIEHSFCVNSPLSTIIFSIFHGSFSKIFILSTIDCSQYLKGSEKIPIFFDSESDMINHLIQIVLSEDPDILVGFEVDNRSWGLVAQRFEYLNQNINPRTNFQSEISRIFCRRLSNLNLDPYITRASSNFQAQGRIVLNLWRIYREEVSLRLYTLSDIYKHYFNSEIPNLSHSVLAELVHANYYSFMKHITLIINCISNLTLKTSFLIKSIEFSRLFGIDLFSTLTRGSQYRVESILISAAHSENFLLKTPTEPDVRKMRAAQGLPLTMEPISDYYKDPIVILDFQSLYPSIIIAYNFCYSTVFGVMKDDDEQILSCGAVSTISPENYNLESFSKISQYDVFKAPSNIVFAKKNHKNGLLPRLLNEILSTRVSIKKAMNSCDLVRSIFRDLILFFKSLKNVLDARQLALKYISNVTYGYTSASFSGRMPNVDIADAIVLSGRKTLERAVDMIESHNSWEARVVYGDTDRYNLYFFSKLFFI